MLLKLDLDSDDDLEEYDPSIISTLGSTVRITPKKAAEWTEGDVLEIFSDEDGTIGNVGGSNSKHVDEIAQTLGALNLSADSTRRTVDYVDSEDDIFLP
jgi:hypothetical protein